MLILSHPGSFLCRNKDNEVVDATFDKMHHEGKLEWSNSISKKQQNDSKNLEGAIELCMLRQVLSQDHRLPHILYRFIHGLPREETSVSRYQRWVKHTLP